MFKRTLGRIPYLQIVGADDASDLVLSASDAGAHGFDLTPRERDVIALLAEGLSNKAIGQRLGISPDTAKFHVGRLIDKLDATGRTDAVAHAARRGAGSSISSGDLFRWPDRSPLSAKFRSPRRSGPSGPANAQAHMPSTIFSARKASAKP